MPQSNPLSDDHAVVVGQPGFSLTPLAPQKNSTTSRNKDTCMSNNQTRNEALRDRLSRYREIKITVTGRKSGRTISIPVWFVLEDDKLYLLPVQGSDTQWYKNVLKNPMIRIDARDAGSEVKVVLVTVAPQVSSVVEKFRDKYGTNDVKKYYSKFDVAVIAQIP
jgi:deazaflavin-dependent oxidoreductase (nitroreductase family)